MSRLTNKNMEFTFARTNGKTMFNKIYHKLSQLEDIEEELGCSLEVVFKALKDGQVITKHIVDSENPKVILLPHKIAEILFYGKNYRLWAYENGCGDDFYLNTKDYGKTWALDRHTLEK